MEESDRRCATGFIEQIWNRNRFELISEFLHPDFTDHSLPAGFQNEKGLILYLKEIGKNIKHQTRIEDLFFEEGLVVIKIRTLLKAVDCAVLTGDVEVIEGYRFLHIHEQKIREHWELI